MNRWLLAGFVIVAVVVPVWWFAGNVTCYATPLGGSTHEVPCSDER